MKLKVVSLEKYQHYKNRNMIWIKWHIDCLQDCGFMQLNDSERWVFIGLVCLACKSDNQITYNPEWLERTLNTKDIEKSIKTLIASNMLADCYQDASNMLAQPEKCAIPIRIDKIREDKKRIEEKDRVLGEGNKTTSSLRKVIQEPKDMTRPDFKALCGRILNDSSDPGDAEVTYEPEPDAYDQGEYNARIRELAAKKFGNTSK